MTSSQPVVTPNAINFTPDNKRCYVYSGVIGATSANTQLIEFNTNTEYIKAKLFLTNSDESGDNFLYTIYLNDIICMQWRNLGVQDPLSLKNPIDFIIPPFTNVKINADNEGSGSARNHTALISGKAYGMTKTDYQ